MNIDLWEYTLQLPLRFVWCFATSDSHWQDIQEVLNPCIPNEALNRAGQKGFELWHFLIKKGTTFSCFFHLFSTSSHIGWYCFALQIQVFQKHFANINGLSITTCIWGTLGVIIPHWQMGRLRCREVKGFTYGHKIIWQSWLPVICSNH